MQDLPHGVNNESWNNQSIIFNVYGQTSVGQPFCPEEAFQFKNNPTVTETSREVANLT